jgi:DNA-binding PucR family transcriptional regulator
VDLSVPVTTLVHAALGDDTGHFIEAAEAELHRPLGLVSRAGVPLGCAPSGDEGRRALAVAEAAARTGLKAAPGWRIVPIARHAGELGFLAIGARPGLNGGAPLLDLVTGLLAEHVERRELARAHRSDFVRRLVSEPVGSATQVRRLGAELGLALAEAYWPALLGWRHLRPQPGVVESVARRAGAVPGALSVGLGGRLVLLHPAGEAPDWLGRAVLHARRVAPASGAQAIVADGPAGVAELSEAVAELEALWRLGPRAQEQPLLEARRFALDRLLSDLADARVARAFVAEQLEPLIEWDRDHRGDLVRVLEAALDYPRHEHAAGRCFMHRNTFRHRLRLATHVLGRDLEDPDVRLAVHVALKLHRLSAPS